MTVLMKMVIAILIGGYEGIHEQQEHAHEHITTVPEDIACVACAYEQAVLILCMRAGSS